MKISRTICRAAALTALLAGLSAVTARPAAAQSINCSDAPYSGLIDGNTIVNQPAQITIDGDCSIRNFPAGPDQLESNISFYAPGGGNWLIVFDNVFHNGEMSCNSNQVHEHKIWFTNSSGSNIRDSCRDLFIPVEKIDKDAPGPTASVGVPFTYTLTIPVLFDPNGGIVIDDQGSQNDLHGVVIHDDLNETGVDLSYISHIAYWEQDGTPVSHTFSNVGGLLTFDIGDPNGIDIVAGDQIVIEITVVLDNTQANVNGTVFSNTARWEFGREIEGVFYEPLPGEWGISPPMTIAGPDLTVTKTGPTFLNLGEVGVFTLDVQNIGNSEAWNATLLDVLPDVDGIPGGGMCVVPPNLLSAQVFAADGMTPVPGKGPLVAGPDYVANFAVAPDCELSLSFLSAAGTIGPGERLIVTYEAQLDDDTSNGFELINVAGATEWFNGNPGIAGRQTYTETLSDGTPGTLDHEDSHIVTAALFGSYFNKTVTNVSTGGGSTAAPGDTVRYTLRLRTTDSPLIDVRLLDDLGALNTLPYFVPGSLVLDTASLPLSADSTATDPDGGTNQQGLLDVRNIDVPTDSELIVEFELQLAAVIPNGTIVFNQSQMTAAGAVSAVSDDPTINGQASPDIDGDEEPTELLVASAPAFDIDKVSSYPDGDPNVLMAGERLRYTITVTNSGSDDAVDVVLRDQIPVNTGYVAGSTTLNGIAVADPAPGLSPLSGGLAINAPATGVAGSMPADPAAGAGSTATIQFEVLVDPDVADGTIIANQAFVDAVASGLANLPSDDPRTPVSNDPTRDVVGNLPLIYAEKSARLETDFGTPGIVDPGDTLRYTITVYNNGQVPATAVAVADDVPANTTYVAGSTTLNGIALGADGGTSPLIAGLAVSSADLTPPLPAPGDGVLSPGAAAVIEFDVVVDLGVPPGTLIVNQAAIASAELLDVLTDGDGDPATGPEPTVVVVGPSQQLSITKQIAVVGGGAALAGSTVEYTVRVLNIATVPAYYVTIYDDLDVPVPGQLAYVPGSATMNGLPAGVSFSGSLLTADYAAEYGALAPDAEIVLSFRAVIDASLALGTVVTNTAEVTWSDLPRTATASVSVALGGMPGVGTLGGTVWHDADFDDVADSAERLLEGWSVMLSRGAELIHTTLTDSDGNFRITGVAPTYVAADRYTLRFAAPGAGPATAALGETFSDFTDGLQVISDVAIDGGGVITNLHLPIDPNGVVYNSAGRIPVPGALLTMLDAATGTPLPQTCFDQAAQQGQVTLADGYYKFNLNFAEPACAPGGDYVIAVTPPSAAFIAGPSEIIPPSSSDQTAPFSVPQCLVTGSGDAIPASTHYCEAALSEFAPGTGVPSGSPATAYYLRLLFDASDNPGSRQIFNNHIPLDPDLSDAVSITKTTPSLSVNRGQLVPYVITVNNDIGFDLTEVSIVDRPPVGFRYVEGSARIDSVPTEPALVGRDLVWSNLTFTGAGSHRIELLMAVGAGVSEGDFVNRAQVTHAVTGDTLSGEATATVRLVPDPDFDCTDVTGKVYDDANRNGRQDAGEPGIGGVRLVTTNGLAATTDQYGRYHITCATVPNENRGSNFVLKLDDRTLPSGFRASLQPLQIARATRGKALQMDFGASIHRVVGLDIADPIFVPDSIELRPQWQPRIVLLLDQLQAAPSVLRLSYLADIEDRKLVEDRLDALETEIRAQWNAMPAPYELEVEAQVFWRLGEAPDADTRQRREGAE